ncbi:MAG TPA: acyl-CoA dehydrogenase [Kiloniellales bacterium]|jgi:alkylation response protein AidB-like acyl-CoA dehydrogenase|nr:acyl-CoA dehydrogenase [Kiloniellales bacterium]
MTDYRAPVSDMRFVLENISELPKIAALPGYEDATPDLVEAVLEEAGKLAANLLAPLNQKGDEVGSVLENGVVRTPNGFAEAYRQYVEGGWNAVPFDPEFGGQGLPWAVGVAAQEMWNAANMSFALCPLLTQGAVELLQAHGSQEQKDTYLAKLISGSWTGTMNLTEPQAGTDVGAVRTRAVKEGDHWRISGQKIFITWGEHDVAENIVHMVLARTPDAPEGTRGLSLFLVPKFLPDSEGRPGKRNDLRCVSLEHKLGIKASPTCVMSFGDNEGAVGFLIGEELRGMEYMFTMMNNARLSVGVQGVAIADRAYQQALAYARQRIQGREFGSREGQLVPIIRHPDVRRMLMTMRALTEAARTLAYYTAAALDHSKANPDPAERERQTRDVLELLIPVTKAWCTDVGCEVASLGIQVHGGMGFIEETGAAQHYRDARITPIYEGTNGVQALDLISRKIMRHKGEPALRLLEQMRLTVSRLEELEGESFAAMRQGLREATDAFEEATNWLIENYQARPLEAAAGATPYLRLTGLLTGGWLLAKGAIAAAEKREQPGADAPFLDGKIATARFYADSILPEAVAAATATRRGSASALALEELAV